MWKGGDMNKNQFDELLESVQEMDQIAAGEKTASRTFEFPEQEVKSIREKTGLSQARFAMLIGVSKRTLENWEQGRRRPTGPAKALLRLLDVDTERTITTLNS